MQTKRRAAAFLVIVLTAGAFLAGATATIASGQVATSSHSLSRSVSINPATTSDLPSDMYYD
jgi:hypothetical protein